MENIKITFKGSAFLQISDNEKKECNFYSLKTLGERKISVNHHILLVDVSGSMYSEIPTLQNTIKATLLALSKEKNNYVSLISYSGHNESYRIINAVKCDTTSYKMANIYETLDKELYTRSITVISEPLEEAINISKKLLNVCNKHHIALFTDGCLVPLKWTPTEEEEKCYAIAEKCKSEDIYLNAIGFGKYYDREFLKNLISIPNNGEFIHIDEIQDYHNKILEMVGKVREGQLLKGAIKNNDFFLLNSAKRFQNEYLILNLKNGTENILVIFEESLIFDDIVYKKKKKTVSPILINDFMYSLTLNNINKGDFHSAEVTLAQTGDIFLFNKLSNCYSFLERGTIQNLIKKALDNPNDRYVGGKEEIKVKTLVQEEICLLEILNDIIKDEKSKLLWDFKYPYKRIGIKNIIDEDRYQFKYDKTGYGEVTDMSIGSKKLNIGLKVEIKGEVVDILSKLKLDSKIYRDFNLIVNGNINTSELSCILSRKLKMKFKKEGILKKTIKWNSQPICIIDLTKVKTTNKRILQSLSEEDIAQYLYDIEVLSCKAWALNKHIKNLFINNSCESLNLTQVPIEEIDARKAFRVNEGGIFNELRLSTTDNTDPFEVYPATVLDWRIDKFPKTRIQAKEFVEYENLFKDDLGETYYSLLSELNKIKKEKNYKQLLINVVRISCGLIRKPAISWENQYDKSKREFNKELNINMIVDEKVTISTKKFNDVTVREDSYTLLTKCN